MTKEDLENRFIKLFDLTEGFTANHFKWIINEFFESNVCIPKGENRHKDADVFHEWAEDTTKQVQYLDCIWLNSNYLDTSFDLRIKPLGPIYEWQYLIYTMFEANENKLSKFITDDEFNSMARSRSEGWIKIQETKRERK